MLFNFYIQRAIFWALRRVNLYRLTLFLYFPAKSKKNNSLQKMKQAPSRGQFQMQELRCRPPKKPDSPRMTLISCEEQHIKSY
jgi:hypothetical protein